MSSTSFLLSTSINLAVTRPMKSPSMIYFIAALLTLAEICSLVSSFSALRPSSKWIRHFPHPNLHPHQRLIPTSASLAVSSSSTITSHSEEIEGVISTVALLVPSTDGRSRFGSKSPVSPPTFLELAEQLARKIRHFSDGRVITEVVTPSDSSELCLKSDALIAIGLTTQSDIRFLSETFRLRRAQLQQSASLNTCQFAIDCGGHSYAPIVGPYDEANPSLLASLAPWSDAASGKRLSSQMTELFDKHITDEFALAMMLFFNRFSGHNIPWVQHSIDVTWEKGIYQNAKEIFSMITKCGPCITKCLADENCSACIKFISNISFLIGIVSIIVVLQQRQQHQHPLLFSSAFSPPPPPPTTQPLQLLLPPQLPLLTSTPPLLSTLPILGILGSLLLNKPRNIKIVKSSNYNYPSGSSTTTGYYNDDNNEDVLTKAGIFFVDAFWAGKIGGAPILSSTRLPPSAMMIGTRLSYSGGVASAGVGPSAADDAAGMIPTTRTPAQYHYYQQQQLRQQQQQHQQQFHLPSPPSTTSTQNTATDNMDNAHYSQSDFLAALSPSTANFLPAWHRWSGGCDELVFHFAERLDL